MNQRDAIKNAIDILYNHAIDRHPDKDNEIRLYNDCINGIIALLRQQIGDYSNYE